MKTITEMTMLFSELLLLTKISKIIFLNEIKQKLNRNITVKTCKNK